MSQSDGPEVFCLTDEDECTYPDCPCEEEWHEYGVLELPELLEEVRQGYLVDFYNDED